MTIDFSVSIIGHFSELMSILNVSSLEVKSLKLQLQKVTQKDLSTLSLFEKIIRATITDWLD